MPGPVDSASNRNSYRPEESFDQGFSRSDGTVGKSDSSGRVDSGYRSGAASGAVNQSATPQSVGKDALVRAGLERSRQPLRLPMVKADAKQPGLALEQHGAGVQATAQSGGFRGRVALGDTQEPRPTIALKAPKMVVEASYERNGESVSFAAEAGKLGLGVSVSAVDTDGDGKADVTAFKWEVGPFTVTHQGRHVDGLPARPDNGTEGGSACDGSGGTTAK